MANKAFRTWAASALTVALLAACGGGDPVAPGLEDPAGAPTTKGSFTALVSFGDSLSDIGTYAPATSLTGNGAAPYFGGKFTANSATAKIWVENLATTMGVVVTPAEVGFAGTSVKCPAAANPALAGTCTAYGQGGALVTGAAGRGSSGGALTVPLKTQIANHLARFTSFKATDLVVILAGNNDGFNQFDAFAAAATQIGIDEATGKLTADQANKARFEAQTAGEAAMKQAGQELAGYIRNEILAKGAKYVAVLLPLDAAVTPAATAAPAAARPVFTVLTSTFSLWLRDGLAGQPVKLIDPNVLLKDAIASPARYALANVTIPACDRAKVAALTGNRITDGSSLFCNSTTGAPYNTIVTGIDVNTSLFADGVHPTPAGHKALSDYIAAQLRAFGWI